MTLGNRELDAAIAEAVAANPLPDDELIVDARAMADTCCLAQRAQSAVA